MLHRGPARRTLAATAFWILGAPSALLPLNFDAPRAYSFGMYYTGSASVVADFNGDGQLDIAATVSYLDPYCPYGCSPVPYLEVFLGLGNGNFSPP